MADDKVKRTPAIRFLRPTKDQAPVLLHVRKTSRDTEQEDDLDGTEGLYLRREAIEFVDMEGWTSPEPGAAVEREVTIVVSDGGAHGVWLDKEETTALLRWIAGASVGPERAYLCEVIA